MTPRTAYVHVPFCAHHCGYCDFAVTAGNDHLIDLYTEALSAELATLGAPRPVESLFVGGGTPTHLSAEQLRRLLDAVTRWLPLAPLTSPLEGEVAIARNRGWGVNPRGAKEGSETNEVASLTLLETLPPHPPEAKLPATSPSRGEVKTGEFSIEANPDTLTGEKAAVMAAFGVNRVSLGVQSFRPDALAALDRRHAPEHVARAVEAARTHIPTLSFDLIFGAPSTTADGWATDLDAALAFEPQHMSTYGLTYEKGTPLWKRLNRGQLTPASEDDELAMYEHAMDRLSAAGFEHYEISNFARPGFRCRHNERYWANDAYYGFGVGAARYVNGVRELNVRDTKLYIRKALAGDPLAFQREELAPRARAFETIATQLRRSDGIARTEFRERTGFDLDALAPLAFKLFADTGITTDDGERVRLTRRGKCVADAAVAEVLKYNS